MAHALKRCGLGRDDQQQQQRAAPRVGLLDGHGVGEAMSRVTVDVKATKTIHGVSRDGDHAKHPDDFKHEVERKVREALEEDGTDVTVEVTARDG